MEGVIDIVIVVAAVLVIAAAFLALARAERGPSMLDRALGLDLLTAALVGAIAIEAVWHRRTETIPILVALSLVGFVGSVVISRFVAREPDSESSGRRPEEVAAQAKASDVSRGEQGGRVGPEGTAGESDHQVADRGETP